MSDVNDEGRETAVSAGTACSLFCPKCETPLAYDGELKDNEGVCASCCEENQAELDEHNARADWWNDLSDSEREAQIRFAIM